MGFAVAACKRYFAAMHHFIKDAAKAWHKRHYIEHV